MSDIIFVRDTVMPRDIFEQLPDCNGSNGADLAEMARAMAGRLCRAKIERNGKAAWHAIAWTHFNGTEGAVASRVVVGTYTPED